MTMTNPWLALQDCKYIGGNANMDRYSLHMWLDQSNLDALGFSVLPSQVWQSSSRRIFGEIYKRIWNLLSLASIRFVLRRRSSSENSHHVVIAMQRRRKEATNSLRTHTRSSSTSYFRVKFVKMVLKDSSSTLVPSFPTDIRLIRVSGNIPPVLRISRVHC